MGGVGQRKKKGKITILECKKYFACSLTYCAPMEMALSLTVNVVTRLPQAGNPPLTQVTFIHLGLCLIFESSAKRKSQLSSYHKKRWKDIKLVFLPS
jgi:hypothetical protein